MFFFLTIYIVKCSRCWNISRSRTKPTKWPAKTQISLNICPVWSVFAVRSIGRWGPKLSSCGQRRLWSDWADAQTDLSLLLGAQSFCWFCHARAHVYFCKDVLPTQGCSRLRSQEVWVLCHLSPVIHVCVLGTSSPSGANSSLDCRFV